MMKKIWIALLAFVLLLSSCAEPTKNQVSSSTEETTSVVDTLPEPSSIPDTNEERLPHEQPVVVVTDYEVIQCQDFLVPEQYAYGSVQHAYNDTLLYTAYPIRDVSEGEETKSLPSAYLTYNLETGENSSIGSYSFSIGGGNKAYIQDQYVFLAPLTYIDEKQVLQFIVLDANDLENEGRILYEHEAAYVNNSVEKLSETEVILYFDAVVYDDAGKDHIEQKIIKYDIGNDQITELKSYNDETYRDNSIYPKTPWWVTTWNGNIYVLLHENQDGNLRTYINVLDKGGNMVEEKKVDILGSYGTMNVNSFTVRDSYYLFHYYYASDIGEQTFVVGKASDQGLEFVPYTDQSPTFPIHDGLVRDRYIISLAGPEGEDYLNGLYPHQIVVYDIASDDYWYVDIPEELFTDLGATTIREFSCVANTNGDIFIDRERVAEGKGIAVISGDSILGNDGASGKTLSYDEYFANERFIGHNKGNSPYAPNWRIDDGTLYSYADSISLVIENVTAFWYGYDVLFYVANETELGMVYKDGTNHSVLYESSVPIRHLCGDRALVMFWDDNGDIQRLHIESGKIDLMTNSLDLQNHDILAFRSYSNFGCFWGWEEVLESPEWVFYDINKGYIDEVEGVFPL